MHLLMLMRFSLTLLSALDNIESEGEGGMADMRYMKCGGGTY